MDNYKNPVNQRHHVLRNNSTLTEKSDTIVSVTPTNSFGAKDKLYHHHDQKVLPRVKMKLKKSYSNASNSSTESSESSSKKHRNKIKKSNTTSLYDLMYVDGRRISYDRGRLATKYTLVS